MEPSGQLSVHEVIGTLLYLTLSEILWGLSHFVAKEASRREAVSTLIPTVQSGLELDSVVIPLIGQAPSQDTAVGWGRESYNLGEACEG